MNDEITIRTARPEDAQRLLEIYAPYVQGTAITFEYEVPSAEEFAGRIKNVLKKYPYLVAEMDGVILGYAYAGVFKGRAAYDWAVEATVYVRSGNRRGGVGRRLYARLEELLRAQGILNMYACIAFPREKDEYLTDDSVRFHERLGFEIVGRFSSCGSKFGRWYDMVWMEKMLGEHRNNPQGIVPFNELPE